PSAASSSTCSLRRRRTVRPTTPTLAPGAGAVWAADGRRPDPTRGRTRNWLERRSRHRSAGRPADRDALTLALSQRERGREGSGSACSGRLLDRCSCQPRADLPILARRSERGATAEQRPEATETLVLGPIVLAAVPSARPPDQIVSRVSTNA